MIHFAKSYWERWFVDPTTSYPKGELLQWTLGTWPFIFRLVKCHILCTYIFTQNCHWIPTKPHLKSLPKTWKDISQNCGSSSFQKGKHIYFRHDGNCVFLVGSEFPVLFFEVCHLLGLCLGFLLWHDLALQWWNQSLHRRGMDMKWNGGPNLEIYIFLLVWRDWGSDSLHDLLNMTNWLFHPLGMVQKNLKKCKRCY